MKKTNFILAFIIIMLGIDTSAQENEQHQILKGPDVIFTPQMTRQLIDSIRTVLVNNYIFPDTAAKMVAYLEKEYKKGSYSNIKDPRQLADQLNNDLHIAHHDGHLRLMYDPEFAHHMLDTIGEAQRRKFNDSMALTDMQQKNFFFNKTEVLSGNIGYVSFNAFTGFVQQAKPTFTAAFRFVANTKALIIDLRNNGGGSPQMVNQVESYFFPQRVHMNDIVDRNNNTDTFWTNPAKADGLLLNMPVYILTSKQTFSGAEDFAYGMQAAKRAIVVGDATGGGAHPTDTYNVGMGFTANIPHLRSLNPYTHTDWEGTGVIPDIAVTADDALTAAKKDFLNKQLASAATDREKKQIQWAINVLIAQQQKEVTDSAQLAAYTGTFEGGLHLYVMGNDLYCRNSQRGNVVVKLQHVNNNLFILDENIQLEFVKDNSGKFSGIHWYRADGSEAFKEKENIQ